MTNTHTPSSLQKKYLIVTLWVVQIIVAAAFIAAGGAKLAGVPMMVGIFNQIGLGQWFRIFTGIVEITGALALITPKFSGFGALLLAVTMSFGVLTHLLKIGGNPAPAIILLLITASIAYFHRKDILNVISSH